MFNLNENNRIVMAQHPTDMRMGVNCLSGQVRMVGLDPSNGDVYIFVGKSRQVMKSCTGSMEDMSSTTNVWRKDGSIRAFSASRSGVPQHEVVGTCAADGGDFSESGTSPQV